MIRIEGSKSIKIKKPFGLFFKRIFEKLSNKKKIKLKIISSESNEAVYNGFECYLEENAYLYFKEAYTTGCPTVELTKKYVKEIRKYNKENNTSWTIAPFICFKNLHLPDEKIIKNYLKNE